MIEIRFHGRGGQGSVTAAEILAKAAFKDGKYVQAFPFFGVERRGAPVMAFTRIDDKPIDIRYQIYTPDYVLVLDDEWTVVTKDKMPSAHFEHTVMAGENEPLILTVDTL